VLYALALVAMGVPQNMHAYTVAHPLEQPAQTQTIGQGPVASQEAIKMLGTNGGGFFNANSAHPYENPTPFSNFLQMLDLHHPCRPYVHAGPHDRIARSRMGSVCRDVRSLFRRIRGLLLGGVAALQRDSRRRANRQRHRARRQL
jgi:hypothetical protein